MTDLWWHGLYPLFLSFSHSWRTLRSCCLLNQTSGEGCGIGDVTRSLLHRFSDSLFPPWRSGLRALAPALPPSVSLSLRFSSPWCARRDCHRTHARHEQERAQPPLCVHAETKKDPRNTCARTGRSHLRANLCKLYLNKKAFIAFFIDFKQMLSLPSPFTGAYLLT